MNYQTIEQVVRESASDDADADTDTRRFFNVLMTGEDMATIRWLIKSACQYHPFGDDWEARKGELERLAGAVKAPYHDWKATQ